MWWYKRKNNEKEILYKKKIENENELFYDSTNSIEKVEKLSIAIEIEIFSRSKVPSKHSLIHNDERFFTWISIPKCFKYTIDKNQGGMK